jgi:hypothetical protein
LVHFKIGDVDCRVSIAGLLAHDGLCTPIKKQSYIIRFATFRPCQRPLEVVKCLVESGDFGLGACFSPAWRGPTSAYPRCIQVVTPAAAHDGAPYVGRRGGISCGPSSRGPASGNVARCSLRTAGRASDVVGRPPRRVREGVSDNIRERNSPGKLVANLIYDCFFIAVDRIGTHANSCERNGARPRLWLKLAQHDALPRSEGRDDVDRLFRAARGSIDSSR